VELTPVFFQGTIEKRRIFLGEWEVLPPLNSLCSSLFNDTPLRSGKEEQSAAINITFVREPKKEAYGTVAVFKD
jgi:hypothetical protein